MGDGWGASLCLLLYVVDVFWFKKTPVIILIRNPTSQRGRRKSWERGYKPMKGEQKRCIKSEDSVGSKARGERGKFGGK